MTKRKLLSAFVLAACAAVLAWAPFAAPAGAASDDPVVEEFKLVAIASVSDAVDQVVGKRGFMNYDMRPVIAGKLVGRAVTAKLVPVKKGQSSATTAVSHGAVG